MKDEELKLEQIEASFTLGGVGRCYDIVIHTQIHQSRVRRHTMSGCYPRLDMPSILVENRGRDSRKQRRVIISRSGETFSLEKRCRMTNSRLISVTRGVRSTSFCEKLLETNDHGQTDRRNRVDSKSFR